MPEAKTPTVPKERVLFYVNRHLREATERAQVDHVGMAEHGYTYQARMDAQKDAQAAEDERTALEAAYEFLSTHYPRS